MKRIISRQPRFALGVQVALAVFAHGKATAATAATTANTAPLATGAVKSLPLGVAKFMQREVAPLWSSRPHMGDLSNMWDSMVTYAEETTPAARPLSYEEARLWLQSYNAGPYAVLRYKGTVPYRETRNYVPRVLKYYQEDLSGTPYEKYIVTSARKYGLDPQMIRAIMKTESDFRLKTVSGAGARGLMQVMPCVWSEIKKRYGIEWNYSGNVFEPEKNIEVACAYLAWLRYDFLPQHFAEFEPNPKAPVAVVRDKRPVSVGSRIDTTKVKDEHTNEVASKSNKARVSITDSL